MRAFLDTNILIAGEFDPPTDVTEIAISSLSYAELRFGVAVAGADAQKRVARSLRLRGIEQRFGAGTPFDDRAAVSFGHITELVLAAGRNPRGRVVDLMIAAIAHANDAALITKNVEDFVGLESMVRIIPG